MSDLGILDRYIPEFAAIRNIVRYRHFHQHPVDEHTLRALENIAMIPHLNEPGSNALKKMLSELKSPAILSLAILLHDLGKIEEDDHIEGGIRMAQAIGERLALGSEQMKALLFLVSNHMEMTHISRYRDLDDPQIIRTFAQTVGSVENLNMLYLLTYADLRAVRHHAWSEWIAALLYRLYLGARRALEAPGDSEEKEAAYHETPKAAAVAEYLKKGDSSLVREHLTAMPPRYPACFSPKEIAEHMRMADSLKNHQNALRWVPVPDYSLSQITICTRDRPGLFAEIVGTFASQQISVLDAAVFTRTDGVAIDSFYVMDGKTDGPLTSTKWALVRRALGKTLRGECDVELLIRRAEQNPIAARSTMASLRKGVSFDNSASASRTIIDVEAPDRVGLLYDVANTIFGLGLDISVARIATDERQARDAFYVADREGNKIEDPLRLEEIRITIEKALDAGLIHA
jgi:[protein-PII] uridylyltransferase